MGTVVMALASESHPDCAYHYVFSPECLDRFADQAVGLPVMINFEGASVGTVTAAERTVDGVRLTIDADGDLADRIASPAFVATDDAWNADYSDRVIRMADLKGIGMTDD
jgi:hypothetical protein